MAWSVSLPALVANRTSSGESDDEHFLHFLFPCLCVPDCFSGGFPFPRGFRFLLVVHLILHPCMSGVSSGDLNCRFFMLDIKRRNIKLTIRAKTRVEQDKTLNQQERTREEKECGNVQDLPCNLGHSLDQR